MLTAILDTNVLFQSLISTRKSASALVVDAYFQNRYSLAFSPETLDELFSILTQPRMRKLHELPDDEIQRFIESLLVNAEQLQVDHDVSPIVTRDVSDTKFLALAEASHADYLVTNDNRHLLPLKKA